ncbi:MAG TPA: hypothetical protein VEI82_06055, partial [Myxococcota bacterium]|nr:hypothetical protein [Myxococcota bacterium]
MALERRGEHLEPGVGIAVVGEQACLGEGELQLLLGVLGGIIVEQHERLGARAAVEQQPRRTRARRQRHRRVVQPPIFRDRAFRIAGARRDVGEVQLRGIVALAAREQRREALLRLRQISRLERQQCEPPVDLAGGNAAAAQALELLVCLLDAIEGGEDLCQLESAAHRVDGSGRSRGGDRLGCLAAQHLRPGERAQGGKVPRVVYQCLLRKGLGAIAIVG